ncbi:MAG: Hsp20/alpha crystallin family protein [Myxococcales bacterium]|nr:Hsp20/alpha crystallin family protein [Myxococcales bacterium]
MTLHTAPTLFDRFFADFDSSHTPRPAAARPAVDLVAFEDRIELHADLPGLSQEDVEVQFEDGALTIRGKRDLDVAEGGRVLRRERGGASFVRSFALGEDVDVDGIEANMKDGVLRIKLPRSERVRPRQIPVQVN